MNLRRVNNPGGRKLEHKVSGVGAEYLQERLIVKTLRVAYKTGSTQDYDTLHRVESLTSTAVMPNVHAQG
jgi:hypothetical protein